MSRYIDEKDVYRLVEPSGVGRVHCSLIDELPRADVVEVVRCKDCKHKMTASFNGDILIGCSNQSALLDVCDNGFCSYGERREE
jgi:hypothetical protein